MLVAIDGPAGAGKSTVARMVAEELGFTYLDTGAMYRAVALVVVERGGDTRPDYLDVAVSAASQVEVADHGGIAIDGRDVTSVIRTAGVTAMAPRIAGTAAVRSALLVQQRHLIEKGDWVVEGRDVGTVIAPTAEVKIFLTASAEERARRRASELGIDEGKVMAELSRRDELDRMREHAPLIQASDAVVLDSTGLRREEVVAEIVGLVSRVRSLRDA